jgi:hypothetical protein
MTTKHRSFLRFITSFCSFPNYRLRSKGAGEEGSKQGILGSLLRSTAVALPLIAPASPNLWSHVIVSLSSPPLHGGQNVRFTATVTGAKIEGVTWSVSHQLGRADNSVVAK